MGSQPVRLVSYVITYACPPCEFSGGFYFSYCYYYYFFLLFRDSLPVSPRTEQARPRGLVLAINHVVRSRPLHMLIGRPTAHVLGASVLGRRLVSGQRRTKTNVSSYLYTTCRRDSPPLHVLRAARVWRGFLGMAWARGHYETGDGSS